ncbi:MAG: thermonuclease family protein [Phycisphaerae bacterium]|jgi:micrococcal nuclease
MARYRRAEPTLSIRQRRLRYGGRKGLLALAVALILGVLAYGDHDGFFGRAPTPDIEKYDRKSFQVVHVTDGDTLDVDIPDGGYSHTRIRLWGVDTPETVKPNTPVQHFGPQAGSFTKQMISNQIVTLELEHSRTRDKYNRLLAYVYLADGRMLNRLIVAEGYGYADPRYDHPYKREFERLQKHAKSAGLGLWKDIRNEDLPYYFREGAKAESPGAK